MTALPEPHVGHRHLVLVDAETGEQLQEGCPNCKALEDQLSGQQVEINSWRARYADLRRDREREARANPLWPRAMELFGYWKVRCHHSNSKWSADRFEKVEPFLRADGFDLCKRAIDGAAYDPFVTTRKNGSKKRHDDWALVFRDRGKFEEFACKAPLAKDES